MKKIITLFVASQFIFSLLAQNYDYQKDHYARKVEKYNTVKKISMAGCAVGAALAATGIALAIQGEALSDRQTSYYNGYSQTTVYQEDIYSEIAPAFGIAGTYLLGGSLVMLLISNKKIKYYSTLCNKVSFNFNYLPSQKGITLTYRF